MRSVAITRFSKLLLGWLGIACLAFAGCQRSVNSVGGPFAPAGGSAPMTGSGPLIPLGPITGATRVPPPSTGSSNLDNSYAPPAAPSGGLSMNDALPRTPGAEVAAPANRYRDSLGGMPIQDLASQLSAAPTAQYPQNYNDQTQGAVGSGLAGGPTNSVALASATQSAPPQSFANSGAPGYGAAAGATDPAARMRPIQYGYSVTPPPRYRGIESSISTPQPSPVQPLASSSMSDSWQSPSGPQPTAGNGVASTGSGVVNAVYSSPKTGASTASTADAALPWRSPSVAR